MKPAAACPLLALCGFAAIHSAIALTPVTEESLIKAGIIPDVISGARLQSGRRLVISYGKNFVNSGNLLTKNETQPDTPGPVVGWYGIDLYTLIVADPDAPGPNTPTLRNILHELVVNIPGSNLASGQALQPYRGPAPPQGTHRYVYMLFKQDRNRAISVAASDVQGTGFDVKAFTAKYRLGLPVAVNWFTVAAPAA